MDIFENFIARLLRRKECSIIVFLIIFNTNKCLFIVV